MASATTTFGSEIVKHLLLADAVGFELRTDLLGQAQEHLAANLDWQLMRLVICSTCTSRLVRAIRRSRPTPKQDQRYRQTDYHGSVDGELKHRVVNLDWWALGRPERQASADEEDPPNATEDPDDQERLRLKSSPVEVSHHRPHHLEHNDRDQHAIDRRGRRLGVALMRHDEIVDRLEDDEHRCSEQHQRDDVVDQVFEERNQAPVSATADQTIVQRLVRVIDRGQVLIRHRGLERGHSGPIMPDPRDRVRLAPARPALPLPQGCEPLLSESSNARLQDAEQSVARIEIQESRRHSCL